ncbi:MAG: hypothetical protein M3552_15890, partial [Planctomycetota bacterium]|nr:hypothetical protein [Planctomycetota bacterium]
MQIPTVATAFLRSLLLAAILLFTACGSVLAQGPVASDAETTSGVDVSADEVGSDEAAGSSAAVAASSAEESADEALGFMKRFENKANDAAGWLVNVIATVLFYDISKPFVAEGQEWGLAAVVAYLVLAAT